MAGSIITALQLVAIGFTVGMGFQCFFVCAPLILPYIAATEGGWRASLGDLALLVGGRLLAYALLGALAGVSGNYIDRIVASHGVHALKMALGVLILALGLAIALGFGFKLAPCARIARSGFVRWAGLPFVGFVIGLVPCAPLVAVMFEIALITKSALLGALYALCFGMGTAIASLVTVGPFAGALGHIASKVTQGGAPQRVVRFVCGALIALFGITVLTSAHL